MTRTLSDEDLEAIAERVAARLGGVTPRRSLLLTADELAQELGLKRDYVYEHQVELGAMRLGDGPRARLRFDLEQARQALQTGRRRPPRPGRRS